MKLSLTLLLLALALPMTSMAHSGRTASDGCHKESATGMRHCHNGTTEASQAATRQATPSYWSKDVDVGPEPVAYRPVNTCPVGGISSNLIIDHQPAACGVVRVAPVAVQCTSCMSPCALPTCTSQRIVAKTAPAKRAPVPASQHSFYFKNCEEVFTARRAPLHLGDDGYRKELDLDGDGMACDPLVMWE